MIFTTAYTSSMVQPLSDAALVDLLLESRSRNADRGVTGLLLYRGGRVMQMLEGEERVVRSLYDRIRMDVRHQHVTNVWSSTATQRRFPDWTMGFEDLDGVDRSVPSGHSLDLRGATAVDPADASTWAPQPPSALSSEQADYLERRRTALRRALVSGDRLIGALGIILNGHEPVRAGTGAGGDHLRCQECRDHGDATLDRYPCATAKNALWALEAVAPR